MDNIDDTKSPSSEIFAGMIQKDSSPIIKRIIGFLFRRIKIDDESIKILEEYSQKGTVVFASYHSSNIALLILYILLKRNNFETPVFALEYNPFLFQTFKFLFKR